MSALTSNNKIYKNGDQTYIDLCYRYDGPGKKTDVVITVTGLDTVGITVDNVDVTKGIFDVGSGDWILATLVPGTTYCATVYFTIDDTCVLNDGIEFTLNDNCGCSPEICVTFNGIGCCAVSSCIANAPAYASTAAAAADNDLAALSLFTVTNGDGTSALHVKN